MLVLGAGGAAQAVATALVDAGCASLRVAARTAERAHALAARLRGLAPDRDVEADGAWPPARGDADLVLNATPVRDELLVDLGGVRQVVDMAYRPDGGETALIAAAREARVRAGGRRARRARRPGRRVVRALDGSRRRRKRSMDARSS